MIDIHTHILPGLDDGAQDIYDTISMAALAWENGTTAIVATPHCNIPGVYGNYFGEAYQRAFEAAQEAIAREKIPIKLYPGMEVFTTWDLPKMLEEGRIMTLNQTRYVLMEFDFGEDPEFADEILAEVKGTGGIPVIAHAERFEFVQEDPEMVGQWLEKGYAVQVNKGSFRGRFGSRARRTAYQLLNHNMISAIASDAHSPERRTTCMADVYRELLGEYPKEYLDVLFTENPRRVCRGEDIIRFRRIPFGIPNGSPFGEGKQE